MQLFPDTHPATLHTVLTLSKNNFFYAIDKLLYAKKYKSNYTRKQTYPYKNTRGRGSYTGVRGRAAFNRNHQQYQPVSRSISDDLAEVQRIIGLAEKPYIDVQAMASDENSHVANGQQNINTAHQVVNICMENTDQGVAGSQTFIDNETQEVIEIVCFENDQQIEEQKVDDHMELESFTDNAIENSYLKNQEPPVIVVDGINELNVDGEVKKGCSDLRQLDMELEMNNPKTIDN
ncbi:uncharacterized protein LOC115884511 isoform X2 [Sitophilus oryzae]|nr:uncharacterized protein LOC115884511 isoform X2 [Sitophilus oryzae]